MTILYLATGDAVATVRDTGATWQASLALQDRPTQCLAIDYSDPQTLLCGTFGAGLWRSTDAARSWTQVGAGIHHDHIMAVATSKLEPGRVWAGTEPSAVFHSEDSGQNFQELRGLDALPSASTWSFPPRPWTHHVRWIEPDPVDPGRLFVGIELGGVMRTLDGGRTWEDRKPGSEHDAHKLATHPLAPGRVYEAAGGGFAESLDGGDTWREFERGLTRRYVWGLAVDAGDPDTILVSAAHGPRQAHDRAAAEAAIYRRAGAGDWREVRAGLPQPQGTNAYVLASHPTTTGVFYAVTRRGDVYRSTNAGQNWEQLAVHWPDGYTPRNVEAVLVTAGDVD